MKKKHLRTKVLHIVGARPQFMKLLPLYIEMDKNDFSQKILHTGQHYDNNMSKIFFDQLEIPTPDYNLNINGLSHGAMTGRMIEEIEKILINTRFDFIIIYGDTNSTVAGAIAAKKMNTIVVHVEAGIRNNDMKMPEEINRILSDRIADILFCNSKINLDNLISEGFDNFDSTVKISGDLMLDCLLRVKNKIKGPIQSDYVLVTCHRESNTSEENLRNIIKALNHISKTNKIIFPVHPRTKKKLKIFKIKTNFDLLEPMDYIKFLGFLDKCKYIITDSGGAIREAYWLQKPSLLILEKPIWPELVDFGLNTKPLTNQILEKFAQLDKISNEFKNGILGEGNASKIITETILNYATRKL